MNLIKKGQNSQNFQDFGHFATRKADHQVILECSSVGEFTFVTFMALIALAPQQPNL